MGKRLLIIDPAFSEGEGHHLAANVLLTRTAHEAGFDSVCILCRNSCPLPTIADGLGETVPTFDSTPYAAFRVGDLPRLAALNHKAQEDFDVIPADMVRDGDELLVHTVNEVQFTALTRWLAQMLETRDVRVRLALMFPVGLEFSEDGVTGVRDPAAAMIFRHGAARLAPFGDRVRWLGIGRSIAREFNLLTGNAVGYGPALVPGIGAPLAAKPDSAVPNIVLYMGDAKFDKGFHHLPAIITRLRNSPRDFRATVQVSGGVIGHFTEMRQALESAAQGDPRFIIHNGRLSDADYERAWQQGHIALLGYDPGVYKYKSSGLCWEAMNYAVPAVVLKDTFHHREVTGYGFDPIVVNDYWPEQLFAGLERGLAALPQMAPAWQAARAGFVDQNQPAQYFAEDLPGLPGGGQAADLRAHIQGWQRRCFDAFFGGG